MKESSLKRHGRVISRRFEEFHQIDRMFFLLPRPFGILLICIFCLLVLTQCTRRAPIPPPSPPPPSAPSPDAEPADRKVAPPELEIWIEPEVIEPGGSALLSWTTENADQVHIEPDIGPVEVSGKIRFFPETTSTYTVRATGNGGSVSESATVEVLGGADAGSPVDIGEEDLRRSLAERFEEAVKPVFFSFDSAELSEEGRLTLEGNIGWLSRPENTDLRFVLEGHADERGSEEYNLALGDKRAQSVRAYLVANGIDPDRIETISLGEERPFDPRATEEAYALNRRVQFVLIKK